MSQKIIFDFTEYIFVLSNLDIFEKFLVTYKIGFTEKFICGCIFYNWEPVMNILRNYDKNNVQVMYFNWK